MDRERRRFLASLGAAPLAIVSATPPFRAAAASPATPPAGPSPAALVLEATPGGEPLRPPLRFGDVSPGPVLRVRRGAETRIILRNRLTEPTSLDLHGVQVPAPLGGAGPLGGGVPVGREAEIAFAPPDSGTFWFHPWILDRRIDQTALGLAGILVVEEDDPPDVDAERMLILSDRDAALLPGAAPRRLTDRLWIDGGAWPQAETRQPGSRLRLRVVNASTRVAVVVACRGADPTVVAVDGQPSEPFKPLGSAVPVGPGARFDLVVDLPRTAGAAVEIAVGGSPPDARPETALVVTTDGAVAPERPPIQALPPNPRLPRALPLEASRRATLNVERQTSPSSKATLWTVNGISGAELPKRPLFTARRGSPVTLAFKNTSDELIAFRLHGFAMRLLHDLDDGWEPYWRESVMVPPRATHHAAFLADRLGRWLVESPFFDQAAGGLRGWFEVS